MIWQGAEYRGRGRQTRWRGHAKLIGASYQRIAPINAWNHERPTELRDRDLVTFDTLTTGNFGGFDAWLDEAPDSKLEIEAGHVAATIDLAFVGLEDRVLDAGGLERKIRLFRLPSEIGCLEIVRSLRVPITPSGDNPIWVRVTTEDGFNAWSSPIFVYREHLDPLMSKQAE